MIVKTDDERAAALREKNEALQRLAKLPDGKAALERLEAVQQAMAGTREEIRRLLSERDLADPDAIVSELARKAETEAENARLRKRLETLDAQLTALEEIRKTAAESSAENGRLGQQIERLNTRLAAFKAVEKAVDEASLPLETGEG